MPLKTSPQEPAARPSRPASRSAARRRTASRVRIVDIKPADRFRLSEAFVAPFAAKPVPWGPLGYFTYKRTYAHPLENGQTEEWHQTVRRVVEGAYTIQKWHCNRHVLPWSETKAQRSAQEMFRLIFEMKFLPPGRGLWAMGSETVEKYGSAPLFSCSFTSSDDPEFSRPYTFLMDMSMLGVGVGFDTRGAGKWLIRQPRVNGDVHVVEDSREGWVGVVRRYLDAYVGKSTLPARVDFSQVRPAGTPIKGFGGIAAGPAPLERCLTQIQAILEPLVRHKLTSAAIVDLMNVIGVCVVSGNIRRCLPVGTLVHTEARGLVPIEKIKIGERVLTSGGGEARFAAVAETLAQGPQDLVSVRTQMGVFECTPNHRVAVLTSPDAYVFKRADELEPADQMVFVDVVLPGRTTSLPPWAYDRPPNSTTCLDITVPQLDPAMAWWMGYLHGDGYVRAFRERNGFNAAVSIAVADGDGNTEAILERVRRGFDRFGVHRSEFGPRENDRSYRVHAQSKQLAWYLDQHVKRPKESLTIPTWILEATPDIRAAYLAGLFDADGSVKTQPVDLVTSIYPDYLRQVRALYASLGVPTRLRLVRPETGSWKTLYALNLVGERARSLFVERVAEHAVKRIIRGKSKRSGNDFGYPAAWITERGSELSTRRLWPSNSRQMTLVTYERAGGELGVLVPVEVLGIEQGREDVLTYDLSVPGPNEFVAEGMLVHNSAELALGSADDQEFLSLKDPDLHSAELMNHRWASNNSVIARVGMDYAKVAELTAKNGEPGYVWLDNCRTYGRMSDPRDPKADPRIMGVNPCSFAGETLVHTTEGPRRIDELDGRPFWALLNGRAHYSPKGSWVTGEDDILTLTTDEGYAVNLTRSHRVMTETGEWREAGDLAPGDRVMLSDHRETPFWPGAGTAEEGHLLGHAIGDGNFGGGFAEMSINPRCLERFGLTHGDKHLNTNIERASSAFQAAFIRGMFDTDGHVEPNLDKGAAVRFARSSLEDLQAAQRMLLRFGVKSRISESRPEGDREMPNGRGDRATFHPRAAWRLVVSPDDVQTFAERIGSVDPEKSAGLATIVGHTRYHKPFATYHKPFAATFRSLEFLRHDRVWDLTVSDVRAFDANGLHVSNSEIALESFEVCNLSETFPSRHATYKEFQRTLKYAYLWCKTVSLIPTHFGETNRVQMRNRRLGVSMSGIVQAMARHGRRAFFDWANMGYAYLRELDEKYSDWLAIPRSIKLSAVKPSGSVSLLPGVTPGIHYEHAEYYYRTIRVSKTSALVPALRRANYRIEDDTYDPSGYVVYFPIKAALFDRAKDGVSMWEQLELAAQMQAYWADNAVSVTITFKPEEVPDIRRALELYEKRLKSVSFLPLADHGYVQAPYITITRDEFKAAAARLKPLNLAGDTHEHEDVYCDGDKCELEIVPAEGSEESGHTPIKFLEV